MIDKVLATIKENTMFQEGDKVIAAVSGGPDSICMLHLLNFIKQELGITLYAAHVNHCLRGAEADKDEEYVKKFCEKLGIPYFSRRIDINKLSKERGLSSESAGREARYEFFQELMETLGANKIALAHNANDQAETVLMRIIRGSGMEGIVGIKPVRGNIFVRPLINIRRDSIEDYCIENKLEPRIDKTNLENIYARNKIRLELIPYIMENFNSDVISSLNRLADTISKDNEYLEEIALEKYKSYCDIKPNKVIIKKEAFLEKEAILTRMVRLALNDIKQNLYNIEKVHIYDLIALQRGRTGRRISLPEGLSGLNNYGDLELSNLKLMEKREVSGTYRLNTNENLILDAYNLEISTRIIKSDEKINFKEADYKKYFDYDKVKDNIIVRQRQHGDRFVPFGMKGSKKLKDLFIDLKIPKEERDNIPLICFGSDIAWIVGYRISELYKVTKETKNVLEIKINKVEEIK